MLKFNTLYGLETYVCGFITPTANCNGRFSPRYDLGNILYFVEEINRFLAGLVERYSNCYFVDTDTICATFGKKFSRDDFYWQSNHGGMITDAEESLDATRLQVTPSAKALYRSNATPFVHAIWQEIIAMNRTLHAIDSVKMVVVDLDDTLWRGLVGEGEADINGWPGGLCEALNALKHRGILLAVISRNDETVVRAAWTNIMGKRLSLDDFVVVHINHKPKSDNMRDILTSVNLLSRNVVFIDDNPVEREAMQAAFPEIRVLGAIPAYLKRILMWSSETQVATISSESAARTTLTKAQIDRDESRRAMSREAFLAGLSLGMTIRTIRDVGDPSFARSIELLNKTNQFNTAGLKFTHAEAVDYFESDGLFYVFEVRDKHTRYGLVGVLACRRNTIEQYVMSCRVAGLDIEKAAMAAILPELGRHHDVTRAILVQTNVNLLCRDVFANAGFQREGANSAVWIKARDTHDAASPPHIDVSTNF